MDDENVVNLFESLKDFGVRKLLLFLTRNRPRLQDFVQITAPVFRWIPLCFLTFYAYIRIYSVAF